MLLSNLQYHKRVPSARSWVSILLVAGCALGLLVPVQGFTATPNLSTICEPHFSQRSRLFSSDLDQDQDAMAKMQEDLMAEKILTQEKQIEETEKATADPKAQMPDLTKELAASKTKLEEKPKFLGLPTDLLLQRTMDTFEDVIVHLKRIPAEKGWTKASAEKESSRKTIVVLGSGWAAHALMKIVDSTKFRLVAVSPVNHFVFTPMLSSSAVGTVEYRSMTEAVRASNPLMHEYMEGKATDIDVVNKSVTVQLNDLRQTLSETHAPIVKLEYDHLVCAVGARVDDRKVPGADKAFRLKTTEDARRLRISINECFEYASRPDVAGDSPEEIKERQRRVTFLIAGGGPTGVELAGELMDLFKDVTRPHKGSYPKLKDSVRVVLVHGGSDLVPQFTPALRKKALESLEREGVEVILNTRVTELNNDASQAYAKLSTKIFDANGEFTGEREERILDTGLSVWCAGTSPVPFVNTLLEQLPPDARNRDGRIKVDPWLRAPMRDDAELGSVFVLGDAAACDSGDGKLLPSTAQVAGQEGAFVARLLDRQYDMTVTPPQLNDKEWPKNKQNVFNDVAMARWLHLRGLESAPEFHFLNLGILAYLGGGEALSQVQIGEVDLLAWAGSVGFLLWRSVYLVKQVATRNRVLVSFDWLKSAVFGRDITRF